jgi:hypothetical protein
LKYARLSNERVWPIMTLDLAGLESRKGVIALSRLSLFKELWLFLKEGKRWWLGPLIVVLVLLGVVLVLAQGSALAPFIYALF